jgi:hypothetical protein
MPGVEDTRLSQRPVHWCLIYRKFEMLAYILQECGFRSATDRWLMEFHFDPPDIGKIGGIDIPFSSLTVTFKKITATGMVYQIPERGCPDNNGIATPFYSF